MKTNQNRNTLPSFKEMMAKNPAKMKEWLLPLALYGVVVLGILAGLIPQIQDILGIREEIQSLEKKEQDLETKLQTLTAFSESELDSKLFVAESSLPSDKPVFQAVDLVQSRAGQYGLTVDGFDFSPGLVASSSAAQPAAVSGSPSMELKTTLVGSFESILRFIEAVEKSGPLTDVKGFSVSSAQLNSGTVKTTMILQIYYLPAPVVLPKVSGNLTPINEEQMAVLNLMSTFTQTAPSALSPRIGSPDRINPFTF